MNDLFKNINIKTDEIEIPKKNVQHWQELLDMLVEFSGAQDALINEYQAPYLKVKKASSNLGNLFAEEDKFELEGLYCAEVIESRSNLEVRNAAEINKWKNSIYMENGLIAYLGYPILWPDGEVYGTICLHDNQKRNFDSKIKKQLEFVKDLIENNLKNLYQSQINYYLNQYYSKMIDILPVGIMVINQKGEILKANDAVQEMTGYNKEELVGKTIFETLVLEKNIDKAKRDIQKIISGEILTHEVMTLKKDGEIGYSCMHEKIIELPNGEIGIISIQSDVTDKVESENKIKYASYHDSLTDLYNRSYIEKKIQKLNREDKLPLAVIMADLNALKLVNDSYGHHQGDKLIIKTAEILKNSCREEDLIARWGGDEFVILLPQTNQQAVKKIVKRIDQNIAAEYLKFENGNKLPLSAALGYSVKNYSYQDFFDILNEAESKMYKNKLTESRDVKNKIVTTLLKTLDEKSQETADHAKRMTAAAEKFAEALNLSQDEVDKLLLAAELHDIGKTVIPASILNKKGKLTESEWQEVKTHSAVGHRILNATEEYFHISEEVLAHHEHWDGNGYPRGLKGEDIPLIARIIAIIDAYDVMTNDQVYKKALKKEEALEEIKACAGTQFDPFLVEVFVKTFLD
ncbi:PAS domain S-box-containing protein/diguanylate cyclase (GGDEF) domain-containing protein [Halanaerobium congolense]|jgi:diguanylate cyclase (GGDEF)-like protein/PAS domain S-box-containing protein|uniref:PAS domain S-box-containing protein/diguanylate cyclase (GGDEF) domain-containing protein n=1 Tax=Halanaerobium congolense TaxID=54121 RepID=A0A1H9Z790_9FIRM|nr:HD domain-containing phosphohydrolase [Halanaerobium congolense]PTX17488.1 PAS domain S-box-containing protein/diguanylate cyclase (GGDEF)-like protein [Halanaerobium congolense]SDE98427.1 PAS domain S-box-containing protein/diguanylate cyclase (GGDEF) domain-containing protein [Halanaerobium congolense]SES77206.1 PAS domain S-box-containing protein/diguanylate cyclase (GGDEF) domain-containing protein [Halanaerobium congolense]SFP04982.1 PAS domain S-box-containing protein/diguanylate cycla